MNLFDRPISSVEWSPRARNCLADSGFSTLRDLASADGQQVQSARNAGASTIREFVRGLVRHHIMPVWLRDVTIALAPLTEPPPGFVRLSGVYGPRERWMLEVAIAQLGPVAWEVVREEGGLVLYRSVNGFKEVTPEEV